MEGDVMEKVEATATVADFDPDSGSIPATKVEITVSCRWVHAGAGNAVCASISWNPRVMVKHSNMRLKIYIENVKLQFNRHLDGETKADKTFDFIIFCCKAHLITTAEYILDKIDLKNYCRLQKNEQVDTVGRIINLLEIKDEKAKVT